MSKLKEFKRLADLIKKRRFFKDINNTLGEERSLTVNHLAGSLKCVLTAALWGEAAKNYVVLAADRKEAEKWINDLSLFIDEDRLAALTEPERYVSFGGGSESSHKPWLIDGLSIFAKGKNAVAVATPDIFEMDLPSADFAEEYNIRLEKNTKVNYEEFTRMLPMRGFERKDFVAKQGDFAVRGAIVDVFPSGWSSPLRIEFFGDEIESIREFSPQSQRSIKYHDEVEFVAKIYSDDDSGYTSSFLDYLDENTLFVLDTPESLDISDEIKPQLENYQRLNLNSLAQPDVRVRSSPQPGFNGTVKEFINELQELLPLQAGIFISADGEIHLDRLRDIVINTLYDNDDSDSRIVKDSSLVWADEAISEGFTIPEENIYCFTEHEIFARQKIRHRKKADEDIGGMTIRDLKKLEIGDYVVHDDKGIGVFAGFSTVKLGGSKQDCIKIRYEGDDVLFVHLNYLHKVQQYNSQEGAVPKINKLGSTEWQRKKSRTKKRLKNIARDLIKLYAKRKLQDGFAYPADTVWQKELEASFYYEDTVDQAKSTYEIKKDMEEPTPMDRLVCGDVGYGKTEVAIRAAFKAVQAGKQVAVLVPTTILAQQHYMTFRDRLSRYPVIVEVLSRFRKKAEQKEILESLTKGGVDIIIGTHRILSKDINFKDLGLLVIDEEQRFGVAAKEKLRQLRENVDTLTLTATPIPRTLNFSLMGARDLSVIETPPRNRIPVHTEVIQYDKDTIISAVEREVDRGGQVFYVNDKIEDLEKIAMDLQMLMPDMRIGTAHGQMATSKLETVMQKFIQKKFDILVTTKIIESGLDIPNANTMFINRADMYGLAELYQLRGRVGRTNLQAYCYLLIPPVHKISSRALKRLQAVEEFVDLGSGFQLAMRDLEIRGAGDLLGPDQSGFINEIGLELYQKILDEAVAELRVEEFSGVFDEDELTRKKLFENQDIAIEVDSDALLPGDYIESDTDRFMYYKRLYNISTVDELNGIIDELRDKYGKLPKEARELIFAVKLRIAALNTGLTKISLKGNKLIAEFPPDSNAEFYEKAFPVIAEMIPEIPNSNLEQKNKKLQLKINIDSRDRAVEVLFRLKKNLEMAA